MKKNKSTQLHMYINDVLALERRIKEAVTIQCKDENICADYETSALLNKIVTSTEMRIGDLKKLSDSIGGGASIVKETTAAEAGVYAGLCDMVRKHPVSRMLRDDYTALALASATYLMLYTSAVALRNVQVAAVARQGLFSVAPLILQINHLITAVVVTELNIDHNDVNFGAIDVSREITTDAWLPEGELVYS